MVKSVWTVLNYFSTDNNLPSQVTLLGPTGSGASRQPALRWVPSSYSRYYLVFIRDLNGNRVFRRIYRAESIGCAGGLGLCSVIPAVSINQGVRWWVRPLNDFGFGAWSAPLVFSTISGTPSRSGPIAPNGTFYSSINTGV